MCAKSKFQGVLKALIFSLIAERYEKHVKRILRFLDLGDTKVLSKIKPTQITSMFEKSNDELDFCFIDGYIVYGRMKFGERTTKPISHFEVRKEGGRTHSPLPR